MNNIKSNDYVNVVIQVLAHIPHIRDYFMLQKFDDKSELVKRFGTLVRKIWNPSAFKGQVSPHELLQVRKSDKWSIRVINQNGTESKRVLQFAFLGPAFIFTNT